MEARESKMDSSFYKIAAKIVRFCDEMDKAVVRPLDGRVRNEADKRGLEI